MRDKIKKKKSVGTARDSRLAHSRADKKRKEIE